MPEIRTRFAPSPTGHLHIGGARTALFNWLFARKNNGVFVLRIEDTDSARSSDIYVEAILEGLSWLGLSFDEGPFYQSQRLDLYKKYANQLLEEGKAYLSDKVKNESKNIPDGKRSAIFFKSTLEGEDDFVIIKSDGMPTYHFSVVVDDWLMEISHVIRGSDHLINTKKHIMLYKAFDVKPPKFVHVPMILGGDGERLSKRHGATSVISYKEKGYLSEAIVNYIVRLGWAFGDQEIFGEKELIEKFSLSKLGKSDAIFDFQKLNWLNGYYLRNKDSKVILDIINKDFDKEIDFTERNIQIINLLKVRAKTIPDIIDNLQYFLTDEVIYQESSVSKYLTPKACSLMVELRKLLLDVVDWDHDTLEKTIRDFAASNGLKPAVIIHPLRVVVTGRDYSPGIFEVLVLIGKEKVLKRLKFSSGI